MFPYDAALVAAVQTPPKSIADVLRAMQTIQSTCVDGDGLKWFNGLYMDVTQAIKTRVAAGGFNDPAWLAELDVQFATLYFNAIGTGLVARQAAGCWQALFDRRNQTRIARIQFALAGMNAHINHDLPAAIVATCQATGTVPWHGGTHYNDYTGVNPTLDSLIESAKKALHVRLLGDALPEFSHLENMIAAWGVTAAREAAWKNAELFWHLRNLPLLAAGFKDTLDGLTTVASKALLVPVP